MKYRTLTLIMLALILMTVAAILAFPKFEEPTETPPAKISKLEVKTTSKKKIAETKPDKMEFDLTASFGPKPE